jgi:hypothetical protein
MTQITRQTKTEIAPRPAVSGKAPTTTMRSGSILAAFASLLFVQVLWAEGSEGTAVASAAAIQIDAPAAAVAEKPTQAPARKAGPPTGWKPPKMPEPTAYSTQELDPKVVKELKEGWGVELLGIRNTAAGNFMDFRFKVVDAEKSLPLFDHRIKPYVIAEKSEIKLPVPMAAKVGAFRPTNRGKNIKADKIYYMLFGNPDRHVKTGEKVTVVIGDFKVEHLVVN